MNLKESMQELETDTHDDRTGDERFVPLAGNQLKTNFTNITRANHLPPPCQVYTDD